MANVIGLVGLLIKKKVRKRISCVVELDVHDGVRRESEELKKGGGIREE